MVLLSCSGTGGGIYAKLANGAARHNCARPSPTHNSVAAMALIDGSQMNNSIGPRKRACPCQLQLAPENHERATHAREPLGPIMVSSTVRLRSSPRPAPDQGLALPFPKRLLRPSSSLSQELPANECTAE